MTQLRTDAFGGNLAVAPPFDADGEKGGGIALPSLDVGQPAGGLLGKPEFGAGLLEGQAAFAAKVGEEHAVVSPDVKLSSSEIFHHAGNYNSGKVSHPWKMAAPDKHDWYLQEWFATLGLKQFDLVTRLDYPRGTAHKLWHGLQPYRRDNVEEISALLNIAPHELLMHPDDAMAIRRLTAAVAEVTRGPAVEAAEQKTAKRATG